MIQHTTINSTLPLPVYLIYYEAYEWVLSASQTILQSDIEVDLTIISNSGSIDVPGAKLIALDGNKGYSGAGNAAFSDWFSGNKPYAIIASHDLHVQSDTLRKLLEGIVQEVDIGMASPNMSDAARGRNVAGNDHTWLSGQCLAYRRECIEDIGGFDERFHSYVEDMDIGLRASDAGWRVTVIPGALAHGLGSSWGNHSSRNKLLWPNHVGLATKRGGVRGGLRALCVQVLLSFRSLFRAVSCGVSRGTHLRNAADRVRYLPYAVERIQEFSDRHYELPRFGNVG